MGKVISVVRKTVHESADDHELKDAVRLMIENGEINFYWKASGQRKTG